MRLFDAAKWLSAPDLAQRLSEAGAGQCDDAQCQDLFGGMVSKHIKSRSLISMQEAADWMTRLLDGYTAYVKGVGPGDPTQHCSP